MDRSSPVVSDPASLGIASFEGLTLSWHRSRPALLRDAGVYSYAIHEVHLPPDVLPVYRDKDFEALLPRNYTPKIPGFEPFRLQALKPKAKPVALPIKDFH